MCFVGSVTALVLVAFEASASTSCEGIYLRMSDDVSRATWVLMLAAPILAIASLVSRTWRKRQAIAALAIVAVVWAGALFLAWSGVMEGCVY